MEDRFDMLIERAGNGHYQVVVNHAEQLVTEDPTELDADAHESRLELVMAELQRNGDLQHDGMLRTGFFVLGGDTPNLTCLHIMI